MVFATIDIGHPPMRASDAENLLDATLREAFGSDSLRAVKVIHGRGSSGKPAVLRDVVRNWAYRRRNQIRAVIPGERYDLFDADTQAFRAACGQHSDPDLGASNDGMTILWIR